MKLGMIYILLMCLLSVNAQAANKAEAQYKKYKESWTLHEDHSQEHRVYQELTLYTHTAMNSTYGETFIQYNPKHQKLKIHASYTRQKDGTMVKTPENAFVPVLPKDAQNMPAYNHLQEMVIVHTGLELSATIVLDYSIISEPGYWEELDICQKLLKSSPIQEGEFKFTIPENSIPYYTLLGMKAEPQISNTAEGKTYTWSFKNLPALSRAPETNLQNEDVPGIVFNTYKSAQDAMAHVFKYFDNPQNLKEVAEKIADNQKTDFEKMSAIQEYVISHIDYSPLSIQACGNSIRNAAEVLKTACATDIEKINLLYGLLNASGIKAIPAAACYVNISPEHCALNAIKEWLVLAYVDDTEYRLNVRNHAPTALSSNFLIRLDNGDKIESTNQTRFIRFKASIDWKNSQPQAQIAASFSRNMLNYSLQAVNEIISLRDKSEDMSKENIATLKGASDVNTHKEQDYIFMSLPEVAADKILGNYNGYNSKRTGNLLLPQLWDEEYSYDISLPDNVKLCTPTIEKKIENQVGKIIISLQKDGNSIHVLRTLKINKRLIVPEEYENFKRLVNEWLDPHFKTLLLQ